LEISSKIKKYNKHYNRIRDESLDYKGIAAGEGVNGIHSYPAMFHPRMVEKLIIQFSKENDQILDPFSGSGVSAVMASVNNRKFVGYDINPLAILISKARTTPLDKDKLEYSFNKLLEYFEHENTVQPNFMNIDFWFSKIRINDITKLFASINRLDNDSEKQFFKVCLSETIRTVSRTKPNEFKLVRRKKPCSKTTISMFKKYVNKNIELLANYYSKYQIKYKPTIELRNILLSGVDIDDNSVSLLITSPPYGDSQTTVAYGQFSRLSLQWLGLPYDVDKISLGAKPKNISNIIPSESFYDIIGSIFNQDKKRAMHVYSFYYELYFCIKQLIDKVKKNGNIIFVVGNRTVKGIQLPTDIICSEMFESLGCKHIETRERLIGNKRMPTMNSPSNIRGKKSETMRYEYIVICRRR